MENVGQDPKVEKKICKKNSAHILGIQRGMWFWEVFMSFFDRIKFISQFQKENLKAAEHVHNHVLQHPTKFQAEIIKQEVIAMIAI